MSAFVEGRLKRSPELTHYLNCCLRCYQCVEICSSGVRYDLVQTEIRRRFTCRMLVPGLAKLACRLLLPRQRLLDLVQKLRPGFLIGRRTSPRPDKTSALKQLESLAPLPNPRLRVAFFLGCRINYVYPEIARAVVKVLNWANIDVVAPEEQCCCGAPALALGDTATARRLAEKNLKAFEDSGTEVTIMACALGASTIKNEYPRLLGSEGEAFADRLYEFFQFVSEFIGLDELEQTDTACTYHDPCHRRGMLGVEDPPRDILKRVSLYEEMEGADLCCGRGNLLDLFSAELSTQIAARKVEAIQKTSAQVVVTSCPNCMVGLEAGMARAGSAKEVRHLAQIMAEAVPSDQANSSEQRTTLIVSRETIR